MIELDIPKDIKDYEPNLMFGLTARKLVCGVLALGSALASHFAIDHFLPDNSAGVVVPLILVAVFFAFGWLKKYGMPLEKYLLASMSTNFISPKKRYYKIDNRFQKLIEDIDEEEKRTAKQAAKSAVKAQKSNKKGAHS